MQDHAGRWPRSPASPRSVPSCHPAPPLTKGDPMFPVPLILGDPWSCGSAGGGWRVAPSEPKSACQLLPPLQTLMAFIASVQLWDGARAAMRAVVLVHLSGLQPLLPLHHPCQHHPRVHRPHVHHPHEHIPVCTIPVSTIPCVHHPCVVMVDGSSEVATCRGSFIAI